jgi:hypothetical protein
LFLFPHHFSWLSFNLFASLRQFFRDFV